MSNAARVEKAMSGGQTFAIDAASGLCRIVGTGMWSAQDARAHFAEIGLALRPLRAAGRPLTFLVDMRAAAVQARETAHAMSEGAARLHHAGDIVAVVTGTVLHALQVNSFSKVSQLATFQDMDEALAWIKTRRPSAA